MQRLIHSNRIRWAGKNRCRTAVVVVVMMLDSMSKLKCNEVVVTY